MTRTREEIEEQIKKLHGELELIDKRDARKEAAKRLWDMFASCTPRVEDGVDSIYYDKGDTTIFEADFENRFFRCDYRLVYRFFESEFGYNYGQIRDLVADMVENTLKWKGLAPRRSLETFEPRWKTPFKVETTGIIWWKNTLKWEGLTPKMVFLSSLQRLKTP